MDTNALAPQDESSSPVPVLPPQSSPSQVQVIVKFTTGAQAAFLCQWQHHSVADLLSAIRQHYTASPTSPATSSTPISIPVDRVQFKLLHAGSILAPDTQPLSLLKRHLLVTHSPLLLIAQILPLPSPSPLPLPQPLVPPAQPEPATLFSLVEQDSDNDDDAHRDHDDENAPLNPPDNSPSADKPPSVSPRPVNERLPLLRVTGSSTSRPTTPSSSSPRASPDPTSLVETIVVLCSVSEAPEAPEGTDLPAPGDTGQPPEQAQQSPDLPRGFDALLSQGFSPDDVAAFRRTFHLARGTATAAEPERLRLEDAWVAGDHAADQQQVAATEQSTVKALVKGAALGYFIGVPLILGVKEMASVDRRFVVGAVLGLVINFGVGVLLWINQG